MVNERLIYPVIMTENHDEDGHYFTVTSPNIPGMVTEGDTRIDAANEAVDAIATMLDGEDYPVPQDATEWTLEPNQTVAYIPVDMIAWYREKERALKHKTVRRTITVPEYLNDFAKREHVNVSRIATEALERLANQA